MDGVLIDAVGLNWQAHNEILDGYGVHIGNDELSRYAGRPLATQIALLNETYGLTLDPKAFDARARVIKQRLFARIGAKPGASALLAALRAENIPCVVGTSMPRDLTMERLRSAGILGAFDALVTEDDVTAHKPHPDVYLAAARAAGMPPGRCVVFEDAPSGVAAARAAGTKIVAVRTSYVRPGELGALDLLVDSLEQVSVQQLRALFGT